MNIAEIWFSIIMPLVAVPMSLYLKMVYDNYFKMKNEFRVKRFNDKLEKMDKILTLFYWPLYLKLLSIYQLNYNIPIKNNYEYDSSDSSGDDLDIDEEYVCKRIKCCQRYMSNGIMVQCKSNIPKNGSLICKKCRWRNLHQEENKSDENIKMEILSKYDNKSIHSNDSMKCNECNESDGSNNSDNVEITIPIDIDYDKCDNTLENENNQNTNIKCTEIDLISGSGHGLGNIETLPKTSIIIDKNTIQVMEKTLNKLYSECIDLIENNICDVGIHEKFNRQVIKFIKYCKIRNIINEGSLEQKYNAQYFNVTNNTNKLLSIVESLVFEKQNEYNKLLREGPSVFMI